MKQTETHILASALQVLANDAVSEDGVAGCALREAADRLLALQRERDEARNLVGELSGVVKKRRLKK